MSRPDSRRVRQLAAGLTVVTALALAACSSSGTGGVGSGSGANTRPSDTVAVQKDATIAAELPDSIKNSGVLTAAIDAGFPVNNYFDTDGKTIIGLSPDLLEAVGQVLGVKVQISEAKLATIIPALQAGRYNMAGMVLTDSTSREQVIDLVDFQQAGQQFLVRKGNPAGITALTDTCGHSIAVAQGGTPVELLQEQSKQCTADGRKAVDIQQFADVNQALLAVQNSRADATICDLTKTGYEAQNSNGVLERAGDPLAPTPELPRVWWRAGYPGSGCCRGLLSR